METLFHASQTRAARGEFSLRRPDRQRVRPGIPAIVAASLGDLLIRAGYKLKRRAFAGLAIAWSPLAGSKP